MSVNMEVPGTYPPVRDTDSRVWFAHDAKQVIMRLLGLTPLIGTPGRPLNCEVVLYDKLSRKFVVGPVEFSFMSSQPATAASRR